jgi:hypothetical protein
VKARQVIGVLFLAACVIVVGMMDKQAIDEQQQQYCNNVRDGVWPDYHGTFKSECGGKDPPKFNADLTK